MSFLDKGNNRTSDAKRYAWTVNDNLLARDQYLPTGATVERVSFEESTRQLCSNVGCTSSWTKPWRSRRRPIFENQWGCSSRCVTAMVRASLKRERTDQRTVSSITQSGARAAYRHRIPLGLVMLAQGWITHPQLQAALEAQRTSGKGRIGDHLISECGLEADHVTRGLSVQWSCSVLSAQGFSATDMALVMPRQFVEEFGPVPLRVGGARLLYMGWEDRLDASLAYAVEQMSGIKVESGLIGPADLLAARTNLLKAEFVPSIAEAVSNDDALAATITSVLERSQPLASRLVRLHHYYWLRLWLESGTKGTAGNLPRSTEDMQDFVFTIGNCA